MPVKKYNKENVKLINWCELSSILTGGNPGVVRSNFVNKEFEYEVDKLMRYMDEFVKRNKKMKKIVERKVVKNEKGIPKYVKAPKVVTNYKQLEKLPKGAEKISNAIYSKSGNYYTHIFTMNEGLDVKEWYDLKLAQDYIIEKLKNKL